ncbi:uncharacterized protein LOC8064751 [Sorghum bicolor]|jgi:hypothetical protein|uniref:uncharacterized protein LOC8064751 n=1 Tax=Sorghum bicolor TaxID=4558 RepID=UPI0001A893B6|nr:uncharacterized protein LOC8064751 [Sorghum bicolor]|eukprot:XP_002441589.1 uncharacterized protein LOC8064751 [Sorghum bicolor]
MQVLRLLAPRRGVATTITAPTTAAPERTEDSKAVDDEEEDYDDDDEGSFFELDLSVRASSSSAGSASSGSSDDSDDASLTDLDFVISLHRSRSASPSFHFPAPPLPLPLLDLKPGSRGLRTLSFAGDSTRNAALYGGRRSSFARSSGGSARSLRLFMESPAWAADEDPEPRRAPSRDVIRRYFTKISTRLRHSVRPRRGGAEGGFRRLRKSRSASAAVTTTTTTTAAAPPRRDDSLAEKQDGIASAIAHCKESLQCGLPRSRSDPGNRQAP